MAERAAAFRKAIGAGPPETKAPAGANIGKFLAGGGGGGGKDHSAEEAQRKALEALSRTHDFDERQRRAQEEVLRAQQGLSDDYRERTTIGAQLLDSRAQGFPGAARL
jgi:hypothetical protein